MDHRYLGGHPGPDITTCLVYDHSIAPGNGDQWETFTPLPEGQAGGGLVYVEGSDGDSLVFAGGAERPLGILGEEKDKPNTWSYSFATMEWTSKNDIKFASNHLSYAVARDDQGMPRYFFAGGQVGENERYGNFDKNYEWDAASEDWIERRDIRFARGHSSSSTRAISCGYFLAGGTRNIWGKTRDISYYDIPSDSWTSIGDLPEALNTPVCDIDVANGYLYCETGYQGGGRFSYRRPIRF